MTQYQSLSTPSIPSLHMSPVSQETRRQQTVARLLGAQSFVSIPWQRLLQEGALVQLHIGRCRFSTRLLLEDMGIQVEDVTVRDKLTRWLILGEKRLLPEAYMKSLARIESSARYVLKEHAFRSELGNFVPVTSYVAWRDQTEALRAEYEALRDDIIENHRDLVRQVLSEYAVIATDTYQRLRTTHPELVREGLQQFVSTYCNRIAQQIPTPERIRDSFTFRFFRVDGVREFGSQAAFVPSATETRDHGAIGESIPAQGQLEELRAQQRAILEQDLRQDAQARVNAMLDGFLGSIVGQLRVLTYDAACDVLATLKRRGGDSFSPRSKIQLDNLLSRVRELNFFGDVEMDQMMAQVQHIVDLSPAERQRNIGSIQSTLRAIATATRATLLDLEEETRVPRADLGIAAFPTEQLVNAARAELRLPPVDFARIASLPSDARTPRAEFAGPVDVSLWSFAEQNGSAARTARTL